MFKQLRTIPDEMMLAEALTYFVFTGTLALAIAALAARWFFSATQYHA